MSAPPAPPGRGDPELLDRFESALRAGLRLGERRASRPIKRLVLAAARARLARGRPLMAKARTFWGETMSVALPESVSRQLYLWHLHEPKLTRIFLERIAPGATVFDVGAHIGYYTLLAARLAGPEGRVHAFEPSPETFALLGRNVADHPTISTYNLAVHAEPGELTLTDFGLAASAQNTVTGAGRFGGAPAGTARSWVVRAVSIDAHVEQTGVTPSFVKIDAESAEFDVLRGMVRTLAAHGPAVSVEVGDYGIEGAPRSSALIAWLAGHGYAPWEWVDGALTPHEPRDSYEQGDLLFLPADR